MPYTRVEGHKPCPESATFADNTGISRTTQEIFTFPSQYEDCAPHFGYVGIADLDDSSRDLNENDIPEKSLDSDLYDYNDFLGVRRRLNYTLCDRLRYAD